MYNEISKKYGKRKTVINVNFGGRGLCRRSSSLDSRNKKPRIKKHGKKSVKKAMRT
jgi:hypothetical protein